MTRQPHDCKCVCPCFPKPRKKRVPEAVRDQFAGVAPRLLSVDYRLTDFAMLVVEAGYKDRRIGNVARKDTRRLGELATGKEDRRCSGGQWESTLRVLTLT